MAAMVSLSRVSFTATSIASRGSCPCCATMCSTVGMVSSRYEPLCHKGPVARTSLSASCAAACARPLAWVR